jgi:hypothetical protein
MKIKTVKVSAQCPATYAGEIDRLGLACFNNDVKPVAGARRRTTILPSRSRPSRTTQQA